MRVPSDRAPRPLAALLTLALLAPCAAAPTASAAGNPDDWIERSNQNARIALQVIARFNPEGAGHLGVAGVDEEIFDLKPRLTERSVAAAREVVATLEKRLEPEKDPAVRQDLEILIEGGRQTSKALFSRRSINFLTSTCPKRSSGGFARS